MSVMSYHLVSVYRLLRGLKQPPKLSQLRLPALPQGSWPPCAIVIIALAYASRQHLTAGLRNPRGMVTATGLLVRGYDSPGSWNLRCVHHDFVCLRDARLRTLRWPLLGDISSPGMD